MNAPSGFKQNTQKIRNFPISHSSTHILLSALLSVLFFLFSGTAFSAEKIDLSTSLDFCTDYVWRGLVINDEAVLQPSLAATHNVTHIGTFSFILWGNYDLTDYYGTQNEFSEIDLIASYALPSGPLELEVGIIHYTFPNADFRATTEVYINAGCELKSLPLTFSLGLYYDFDEIDGLYISGKIMSHITLIPKLALEMALSAGYADSGYNLGYFNFDDSACVDSQASMRLTYTISDSFSLSAGGQYMSLLDSALKDSVPINNRNKLSGCLSLNFDF